MKSWKREPDNPQVKQYVECYWFLEKSDVSRSDNYPKLNPDPAAHLIIAAESQAYHYHADGVASEGAGSHWIFPHSQTFQMDHTQPFWIVGVKFRIGALYALELGETEVQLNQIASVNMKTLLTTAGKNTANSDVDLLTLAGQQAQTCCDLLDDWLVPWLLTAHKDKHSELLDSILPLLADTPISTLGQVLHCSQRTVERSFLRVSGLTLKQCRSMNQLETLLEHVTHLEEGSIDWAAIAYEYGFSDQPHLIRTIKDNIGATPGQYAKQRDLTIDIYGDFKQDAAD